MRKLTPRQSEVLDLLFRGVTAAGIGAELKISANTVRKWCCEMYKAAGVTNDRQMVYYALCNDMLKIPGRRIVVDGGPDDGVVVVLPPTDKPRNVPDLEVVFRDGGAVLEIGGASHNIGLAHAHVLEALLDADGAAISVERLTADFIGSGGKLKGVLDGINYRLSESRSAYRVAVTPEWCRLEKRKGRT